MRRKEVLRNIKLKARDIEHEISRNAWEIKYQLAHDTPERSEQAHRSATERYFLCAAIGRVVLKDRYPSIEKWSNGDVVEAMPVDYL